MERSEASPSPEELGQGVFELDISNHGEQIATFNGGVVVDARRKAKDSSSRGWIDPKEYDRMGTLYSAVRQAYEKGESMEEALQKAAEKLGFQGVDTARIVGEAPEHWKKQV
jgi:hypothetical protein